MRTINLKMADGADLTVTNIPDDAKITFANGVNPADHRGADGGYVIRIWQGKENLLLVMPGVATFSDAELDIVQHKVWLERQADGEMRIHLDSIDEPYFK